MMSNKRYFAVSVSSFIAAASLLVGSVMVVQDRKVSGSFWSARFAADDKISLAAATVTAVSFIALLFATVYVVFAAGALLEGRRGR